MKIAYMMSRFPKLTETFILYEILTIQEEGVEVEIYPLIREKATVVQDEAHALVERANYVPFLSLAIILSNLRLIARNPVAYFRTLFVSLRATMRSRRFLTGIIFFYPKAVHIARLMEQAKIEHLHAHFASHPAAIAFIIHELTGIPYSFTAHGSDLHRDQAMLCEKVHAAKDVIAISQYNKQMIIDHCGEQYADRIQVVHCGINTERFQASDPIPDNHLRILCVGSLHEVKGQRYLLEACAILKKQGIAFKCHFIGQGDDLAMLQDLAKQLGISEFVHFLGGVTQAQVIEWLSQVDVLALTSVPSQDGRREGIPVALMEAMASGLPVVSTDLSGIPELVTHGQEGYLTQPGDSEAIAEALITLANSAEKRQALGQAARNKILSEFELKSNARKLLEVIENK